MDHNLTIIFVFALVTAQSFITVCLWLLCPQAVERRSPLAAVALWRRFHAVRWDDAAFVVAG